MSNATFPHFQGDTITNFPSLRPWEAWFTSCLHSYLFPEHFIWAQSCSTQLLFIMSYPAYFEVHSGSCLLPNFTAFYNWSVSLVWIYPMRLIYSSTGDYLSHFDFGHLWISQLQIFEYEFLCENVFSFSWICALEQSCRIMWSRVSRGFQRPVPFHTPSTELSTHPSGIWMVPHRGFNLHFLTMTVASD